MQDGRVYETREEAEKVMDAYKSDGFDARILEENGKFLVFSRRVVKEVKTDA